MGGVRIVRDVVDVLTADHRDVTALFGGIWSVRDPGVRRELAAAAIGELVRHAVVEEAHVHPVVRVWLDGGEAAVLRDVEEHRELERLMRELERLDAADPAFDPAVRALETRFSAHVQHEELDQFPALRRRVPRDELVALARRVAATATVAPHRPGPGLVDRVRARLS